MKALYPLLALRYFRAFLAPLLLPLYQVEKALFASTGTRTREEGHYCRPVQDDARYQQAFRDARPRQCEEIVREAAPAWARLNHSGSRVRLRPSG